MIPLFCHLALVFLVGMSADVSGQPSTLGDGTYALGVETDVGVHALGADLLLCAV